MKRPTRVTMLSAGLLLSACMTTAGEQPGPAATLVGPEWVVEEIGGRGVIDYARATLKFGQDGRLSGDTSCNRYFADYRVDGTKLQIGNAGVTRRACAPAVMDQESRFLDVFDAVDSYRIEETGALILSSSSGATITARQSAMAADKTTYACEDGTIVEAWYPTTETARIRYKGRTIDMKIAVSASGARYLGDGWEWWTKGMTEGTLSPLAPGEQIASARGVMCTAR